MIFQINFTWFFWFTFTSILGIIFILCKVMNFCRMPLSYVMYVRIFLNRLDSRKVLMGQKLLSIFLYSASHILINLIEFIALKIFEGHNTLISVRAKSYCWFLCFMDNRQFPFQIRRRFWRCKRWWERLARFVLSWFSWGWSKFFFESDILQESVHHIDLKQKLMLPFSTTKVTSLLHG